MSVTQPLILPPDVLLVPVKDLPEGVRERVECVESDYAITRPQSRTPSKIIDAEGAALLREFQSPTKIVQAVLNFCRERELNPETLLEDAFPLIQDLMNSRLLVPADSDEAQRIVPLLAEGRSVAGFEVVSCVQVVEDTELYQVKRDGGGVAALKILRPGCRHEIRQALDREAAILRHLDGGISPELYEAGSFEERPYLVMEWCSGVPVTRAAGDLRRRPGTAGQRELLELCTAILDAYAHLHAQGVLHSDVHTQNILVDGDGSVKIIDFGLARWEGTPAATGEAHRGGVGFYFEPEYARACLEGRWPPPSTAAGEQYALAALLYFLLTGAHCQDYSLHQEEMLRQIAEGNPAPFSQRGVPSSPDVEELLKKALDKEPERRFASVAEFAGRLRAAAVHSAGVGPPPTGEPSPSEAHERLLNEVLERTALDGPWFSSGLPTAPTCSLKFGAAGVAYALYRIACIRGDAALLSLADVWCNRALSQSAREEAFCNPELEVTPETVGLITPYHQASGVYSVQALISHAMGDPLCQQQAVQAFVAACSAPCRELELALGKSSILIAGSLLLDTLSANSAVGDLLVDFGERVRQEIWDQIDSFAPIPGAPEISYLGIAHGWAGVLYATLRWCQSTARPLPEAMAERLGQLAETAEPIGRGVRWPWVVNEKRRHAHGNTMPGWCNGSAGFVYLWTLAHKMLGDEAYLRMAEKAAWNTWEEPDAGASLCCGLAGRAYALLCLYKHTGNSRWLLRARESASRAAERVEATSSEWQSLYRGAVGVAVLAADLTNPEASCMPFFEQEGWPARR